MLQAIKSLVVLGFLVTAANAADPQLPSLRGIAYPLVGTNGGLNQSGYKSTQTIITEVKALGANTIRVTVSAGLYRSQNDNASDKALTAQNAPTDAELLSYLRALKDAGLRVYLIPFVNTFASDQVLSGTVRTPTDMAAFMADHTANLVRVAQIAQQAGVDWYQVFMDDTEGLLRQSTNKTYWLDLIKQVRTVYTGTIVGAPGVSGQIFGGSSTHNELIPREILDALDVIGCTCYYAGELTTSNNPSLITLLAGFRGANNHVDMSVVYEYINRVYMKPLLLVDTSYHSFDGSNRSITPIYDSSIQLTADQQEQADLFNSHLAILKEQKDNDWFQGILYSGQNALPADAVTARFLKSAVGENIEGKLAEGIVRGWYTGTLPAASQSIANTSGSVTGSNGDDTITVTGTGVRNIDGGLGLNTLVISAKVATFTITGDFQSTQVSGAGLQLNLANIHSIKFSDVTVKLPTGGVTLSATNGVQTLTGYAGNDFIGTGPADQVIDGGTGNDIVVADPWYRNTLRVRTTRANAFYGANGARLIVTINAPGTSTRWVSAVGLAKIQFDDSEVTLTGDTVSGTALQTHLYGSPANDVITTVRTSTVTIAGSAGNDSIDGGSSIATVSYPERRANFGITQANGVITIIKPNGTDTLRNVRTIRFSDQTLPVNAGGTTASRSFGPVFSSASTTSQSFLRVSNTGLFSGSVSVQLRNPSNGTVLGTWTSPTIAPNASAQFLINVIESAIPANVAKPLTYAVTLSGQLTGETQHVLYRPSDGTLTNLSTCDAGVSANARELINVHSSLLDYGFPSTVVVSNTSSAAASAMIGIYDSIDGRKLGTYTTATVAANGQLRLPIATIQSAAGISPTSSQYHYNLGLEGSFRGYLQHQVNNLSVGVVTDMTTTCAFKPPAVELALVPRVGSVFSSAQPASQSFLRFHNTGSSAGTVSLTMYDAANGAALAQWTSPSIARGASAQFLINTIESAATASLTKPQFYSMVLGSGITGYVQHALYRPADGTLTNLSTCDAGVTANSAELINVHSTILDYGFPSSVVLNNNSGTSVNSVTLGVYDSTNGIKLGTYTTAAIPANGQLNLTIATIEQAAKISPGTTTYHYNIKAESAFNGFLQHLVTNKQAGVVTDMTTVCRLN